MRRANRKNLDARRKTAARRRRRTNPGYIALPVLAAVLMGLVPAACSGSNDSSVASQLSRRQLRRSLRPYDGGPPVIPHAVAELGRHDCLACHEDGLDLGENGLAPQTPHPQNVNCRQCHLEQDSSVRLQTANSFQGHYNAGRGTRPYPGAPPTIPHSVYMRDNCLGCHGSLGGSPIRTPHPDRVNCRQCHVTLAAAMADFGKAVGASFDDD